MRILLSLIVLFASCVSPSGNMGAPQSPSATPTFPATITPPANGDALNATTLNTDVETPLQNGVEAARMLTYGGGLRRRLYCSSNTVMVIQPLGAVVATVAGVNTVVPWTSGAATIDPSALSGGLVANTRYWVYATAVLSAGVPVFVVSTNAPDTALKYSSATTDQMYVSTFYTDAGPNILLYSQVDNVYRYLDLGTGNRFLNDGAATVLTAAPIGASLPTQAYIGTFAASWHSTVAGQLSVVNNGTGILLDEEATGTGTVSTAYFPWSAADGSGQVQYQVNNAATKLTLYVAGFTL